MHGQGMDGYLQLMSWPSTWGELLEVPPSKPNPNVPQRKKTGILGTSTVKYAVLYQKYMEDEGDFGKRVGKMQRRREVTGTGESSLHSRMQPFR